MTQTEALQQGISLIQNASDVLVTTHFKPDGDACGCVAVMAKVLRALGKTARPLLLSRCPEWYAFLFEAHAPVLGEDLQVADLREGAWGQVDLIVILDTNSYSQLPGLEEYLKQTDLTEDQLSLIFQRMSYDKTTPLEDQLRWMRETGFEHVDCFYKYYNFAVYAGSKPESP